MRLRLRLVFLIALGSALAFDAAAQTSKSNIESVQSAEELRLQLLDVEAKESELKARARQLEEDLKPENIERYFAGVGSTRPEDLREMRRRQLLIERGRVQAQLKLIAASRERLESGIRFAESQAYQESAEQAPALLQVFKGQFKTGPRVVAGVFMGLALIVGIVFVIGAVLRRVNTA